MRATALLPLLLLGLLQASLAPAPPAPRADDRPGLRAVPGAPVQPAESSGAIKRLAEPTPAQGLAGDGRLQKGDLAATHRSPLPPRRAATARFLDDAGGDPRADHARPRQPRAPPAFLPV